MHKQISIIIADDHLLFIDGLKMLLKEEPDLRIADVAHDGRELLGKVQQQHPELVLLDINMPTLNGLETAKYLKQAHPEVKFIMLSTYNEDHLIERAKTLGANGYLLKNSSKEELLQTIRLVAGGKACFPYRQPGHTSEFDASDNFLKQFSLTRRELEVIRLIKNGCTNQQISDELYLSVYTVETHRRNIMQKLGLSNSTSLMKFIYEYNL